MSFDPSHDADGASDDGPDRSGLSRTTKLLAILLGVVGLLGGLIHVFAAPLFQPIIYGLVRDSPLLVFWWVPAIVISIGILLIGSKAGLSGPRARTYALVFLGTVLLFSVAVTLPLSIMNENQHLADRTEDKMETYTLDANQSLPAIDAENMRNVPLRKAHRDASNVFQKSKYKLQSQNACDITYVNEEPFWSCAILPDSGDVKWSGYQNGTALISQRNSNSEVYIVEGDVEHGLGVQAWRSNKWHLQRTNYWYDYGHTPFMSVTEVPNQTGTVQGDSALVRPLTVNSYHLTSSPTAIWWALLIAGATFLTGRVFGPSYGVTVFRDRPYIIGGLLLALAVASVMAVPIAPPEFAGAAYQEADGSVEYLSPDEIQDHEALYDDSVYPYSLAETEIEALNWRQGLINVIWTNNNLFDLAGDAADNSYPYTVQGDDGSKDYYFTTVPDGGGDGLKQVFIMDGQTGTLEEYQTGDKRIIGARSAAGYVEGQTTPPGVTNWNEYRVAEVLPVPHNGQLYWMGRIVRTTGPGMPAYAAVNASNPDDIVFMAGDNKDEQAREFASGIPITSDNTTTEPRTTPDGDGGTITQIVVRQDGEIVGQYNVTGNTSIEFNAQSTNESTNTTG